MGSLKVHAERCILVVHYIWVVVEIEARLITEYEHVSTDRVFWHTWSLAAFLSQGLVQDIFNTDLYHFKSAPWRCLHQGKDPILISDLYKLAQLDEVVLTQFNDVLNKADEGLHHKLEALDQHTEELELPDHL